MASSADWPEGMKEQAIAAFGPKGGYKRVGTAEVLYYRPTLNLMYKLLRGEVPDLLDCKELFQGDMIYILGWWGDNLKDQLKLAHRLVREEKAGYWHDRDDRVRRRLWEEPHR